MPLIEQEPIYEEVERDSCEPSIRATKKEPPLSELVSDLIEKAVLANLVLTVKYLEDTQEPDEEILREANALKDLAGKIVEQLGSKQSAKPQLKSSRHSFSSLRPHRDAILKGKSELKEKSAQLLGQTSSKPPKLQLKSRRQSVSTLRSQRETFLKETNALEEKRWKLST